MERYSGNNAYRIKIREREERKLERRDNPKYEAFVKLRKKQIIASILLIMSVAMVVILRYAQISVLNSEIQRTKKVLEDTKTECTNLCIERDRIIDLSHVEEIATESYGMITPAKDQIVYISVSKNDSVKVKDGGLFGGYSERMVSSAG